MSGNQEKLPPLRRSQQIKQELRAVVDAAGRDETILPLFFSNPLYKPKDTAKAKRRQVGSDIKLYSSSTGKSGPDTSCRLWLCCCSAGLPAC